MRRKGWLTIAGGAAVVAGAGLGLRAMRGTARAAPFGYPPFDTPKPIADGIWIVDAAPMRAMGMTLPVRMTVVRLADGGLWLHSPTRYSDDLARRIGALGTVRHLVAPNIAHWTFLSAWQDAHPRALLWAAPGLRTRPAVRRAGLRIDHDLGEAAPAAWADEIDQRLVAAGAGFRELGFLHRASRTLVLTDLIENLEPATLPPVTATLMRAARATAGTTALYLRAPVLLGGAPAAAAIREMVAWRPERVVMAHGRPFEQRAAERLEQGFAWLR